MGSNPGLAGRGTCVLAPVFLDSRLEHPAAWICVHFKSSVLLLLILLLCICLFFGQNHVIDVTDESLKFEGNFL